MKKFFDWESLKLGFLLGIILGLIIIILGGCGPASMFEEISPNYWLNTSQAGTDQIRDTVLLGIQTYNDNYGQCPHRVDIVMRKWGFDCGGVSAGGCSYGNIVNIGVNHTSTCQTVYVVMHELTHACRNIYTESDDWQEPLWLLTYQLADEGKCINGEAGLYNNYVWE